MSDDLVLVPHSVPSRSAGDRTVCTTKTRWLACNMKAALLTAGSWMDARQPLTIPPSSWVFLWSLFLRECSLTSGACQTAEPEVQASGFDTRGVSSSVFCWRTVITVSPLPGSTEMLPTHTSAGLRNLTECLIHLFPVALLTTLVFWEEMQISLTAA